MRAMNFANRKLRGKKRIFAWLRRWSEGFSTMYPPGDIARLGYWNWKIPVPQELVEGRRAKPRWSIACAQLLVDAAAHLRAARPEWTRDCRIVCCLTVPCLFGSEVCVYRDEEYFLHQVSPVRGAYEIKERIVGRSLVEQWGLVMPEEFGELGVSVFQPDDEDGDYRSDWWFLGDVGRLA